MNLDRFSKIIGFEDKYLINENGDIYSLYSNKLLKQYTTKRKKSTDIGTEYKTVGLLEKQWHGETKQKGFLVHRLVAKTFIPNPENKPYINHIDNNGLNNNISNLEWVTHKENVLHSQKQGRMGQPREQCKKLALELRKKSDVVIQKILGDSFIEFIYDKTKDGLPHKKVKLKCPKCNKKRIVTANKTTLTKSRGQCRSCCQLKKKI